MSLLPNWKKNWNEFWQNCKQNQNGVHALTFTSQCRVCMKEFSDSDTLAKHLEKDHVKIQLVNELKHWGYYDHE